MINRRINKNRYNKAPKNNTADKYDNTVYWVEYGIDIDKRRIMLDENVDSYSTGWIVRAIYKMLENDSKKPIDLIINSYGGSVYDGLGLYDVLEACPCPIRTYAQGKVMSMGLVVFLAGDERYASTRATFMTHEISGYGYGKVSELKIELQETERLEKVILDILEEKTAKDKKWWKRFEKAADRYLDADGARVLGIVNDDIIQFE